MSEESYAASQSESEKTGIPEGATRARGLLGLGVEGIRGASDSQWRESFLHHVQDRRQAETRRAATLANLRCSVRSREEHRFLIVAQAHVFA